jgi:hypothetical protein
MIRALVSVYRALELLDGVKDHVGDPKSFGKLLRASHLQKVRAKRDSLNGKG